MALDATVGGVAANSYVTVAEASVLLEGRLHTEPWFACATTDQLTLTATREAALIWATRILEEQVLWFGVPRTLTQALAWPMSGQVDLLQRVVPQTIVPDVIKRATAYLALALLRDQSEEPDRIQSSHIRRRRLGATEVDYWQRTAADQQPMVMRGLPAEIRQMLRPYGRIEGDTVVALLRS